MKRIPIKERVGLVLFLAVIITNPLTAPVVLRGILAAFDWLISWGDETMLAAGIYGITLILWHIFDSEKPKVMPKTGKAGKRPKDGLSYELTD